MEHHVEIFIYLLIEEDERRNRMRNERRQLRDTLNPFEIPDQHFRSLFRLTKPLVMDLMEMLLPHAIPSGNTARVPFLLRILATLHFMGSGSYQTPVGCSCWHSLSQSMVSLALTEVTSLINNFVMPHVIQFPITAAAKNGVKAGFYDKWGMRGIIGAVDGTHVHIIAPPQADLDHPPVTYINRKGKYSLNVMLICNSDAKILAADARFPGSVHDAAIWQVSDVKRHLLNEHQNGARNSYLIGDSGYPGEPWLLTPCGQYEEGSAEERYNIAHKSARNVIERTNGVLKGRFRCLSQQRVLHYHPAKAAQILYACATLHNMCINARLELVGDEIEPINDIQDRVNEVIEQEGDGRAGRATRNMYIRNNY